LASAGVALWLLSLAVGADTLHGWLSAMGWSLNAHGHSHVYDHGHPFVDARSWWGVPNAMDVLTNLPLVWVGGWGLWRLSAHAVTPTARAVLGVLFAGVLLSGLGSAWYHWAPDAAGLAWDRLGMAVAFAGALGLAMHERGLPGVRAALWVLLGMGAVSACLPWLIGQVLPWALIQFGGVVFIVVLAWQRPASHALGVNLVVLIACYAVAKCLELNDEAVFHATGHRVSGHSLKHLAAALAAWPVCWALARQPLRHNASRCAA
jgi:hypothetical protein